MALTLPASMAELLGRPIVRISTSYDRSRIIFDTVATDEYPRTRYAYDLDGGVVAEYDRFTNMVGYDVVEMSVKPNDSDGRSKLYIRTVDVDGWGLIYFDRLDTEEGRVTEDSTQRILEQLVDGECGCRITERTSGGEDLALEDVDVGRKPPYLPDPDGKHYIVEEGDVNYGRDPSGPELDCEGECD